MELFIWIIAIILFSYGAYFVGYNLGKTKLRQDYKDHYREVQLQRDEYKEIAEYYSWKLLRNKDCKLITENEHKLKIGQNLFNTLSDLCSFTALETDMFEIVNAVEEDNK